MFYDHLSYRDGRDATLVRWNYQMYVQRLQLITTVFGCTLFFWFIHCTMRRLFLVAAHFAVLILYFLFCFSFFTLFFFISIFIQDDFNAFPLRIFINWRFSPTIHHTFATFPHGHAWSKKVNEGQKVCSYRIPQHAPTRPNTLQSLVFRYVYYRTKRIGENRSIATQQM